MTIRVSRRLNILCIMFKIMTLFRPGQPYRISACHLSMQHNNGLTGTVLCLSKKKPWANKNCAMSVKKNWCPKSHTINHDVVIKSTLLMSLDVGKSRILTMIDLMKTRTKGELMLSNCLVFWACKLNLPLV
jgi:hypothetical protein